MILLFVYLYILFLFRKYHYVAVIFRNQPSIRENIRPPLSPSRTDASSTSGADLSICKTCSIQFMKP